MSIGQAHDAVRVFQQPLVVRGKDKGKTEAAVEVVHQVNELRRVARVEVGRGFVGQHKSGPMNDGARHGHTLAFAAGEQVGAVIGAQGEASALQSFTNAFAALADTNTLDQKRKLDIFRWP